MNNLEDLKRLYDDRFKCIRYEKDSNDDLIIYLKNFEEEKIQEMIIKDKNQVNDIINFIRLS